MFVFGWGRRRNMLGLVFAAAIKIASKQDLLLCRKKGSFGSNMMRVETDILAVPELSVACCRCTTLFGFQ
jgi:hypothetical protein